MPLFTISLFLVGSPSASNGRDPEIRGLCGFSIIEISLGKILSPIEPFNQEDPRAIELPFIAARKLPIKLLEILS